MFFFCVFCLESYIKHIVVWMFFFYLSYTGGLQIFCKKGKQLWIKILTAYHFFFWSSSLKRGLHDKNPQFLWGQKGQELLYSSPQAPSIFQTITNLMKTFKMKGTDQRVSQIRSVQSAVWAPLRMTVLLQRPHESFSYLWSLQWYMEFIQVLTKITLPHFLSADTSFWFSCNLIWIKILF